MPSDRPTLEAGFPWRIDDVTLRPLHDADLDYLVEYRNLEDVWRLQDWDVPYDRDRAAQLIPVDPDLLVVGGWQQIGIEHAGRLVGDVAILVPSPGDDAWIGYSVHPENWGRGFASRAVALACQRLFEFGAARVRASVDPRNLRSITLLERIGFVQEAETNRIEVRGEIYDDAVYSLFPSLRAVGTDGS